MKIIYFALFASFLWTTTIALDGGSVIVKTSHDSKPYFFTTSTTTERVTTDPPPIPYEYDNEQGNTGTFNYENLPYYFTTVPATTGDIPLQFEYKNGATSPKSLIPSHVLVTLYKAARKNLKIK